MLFERKNPKHKFIDENHNNHIQEIKNFNRYTQGNTILGIIPKKYFLAQTNSSC